MDREKNGYLPTTLAASQQEEREAVGVTLSDGEEVGIVMEDLVKEWSNRLGPNYQVKVC